MRRRSRSSKRSRSRGKSRSPSPSKTRTSAKKVEIAASEEVEKATVTPSKNVHFEYEFGGIQLGSFWNSVRVLKPVWHQDLLGRHLMFWLCLSSLSSCIVSARQTRVLIRMRLEQVLSVKKARMQRGPAQKKAAHNTNALISVCLDWISQRPCTWSCLPSWTSCLSTHACSSQGDILARRVHGRLPSATASINPAKLRCRARRRAAPG